MLYNVEFECGNIAAPITTAQAVTTSAATTNAPSIPSCARESTSASVYTTFTVQSSPCSSGCTMIKVFEINTSDGSSFQVTSTNSAGYILPMASTGSSILTSCFSVEARAGGEYDNMCLIMYM